MPNQTFRLEDKLKMAMKYRIKNLRDIVFNVECAHEISTESIQFSIHRPSLEDSIGRPLDSSPAGDTCFEEGDWDQLTEPFTENYIYKSAVERFEHGADWKETPYYQVLQKNGKGKSAESYLRKRFDRLFYYIEKYGFRRTSIITGHIGRYGDFILQNGKHRISIAKILNIKKVPVKILLIHKYPSDQ